MRKCPLAYTPVAAAAAPGCVGKGKHTFKGSADALVNFTKKGRDIRPTWNRIPRCIRLSHRPTSYTYIKLLAYRHLWSVHFRVPSKMKTKQQAGWKKKVQSQTK